MLPNITKPIKWFVYVTVILLVSNFWAFDCPFLTQIPTEEKPILLYSNHLRDDLRKQMSTAIKQAKESVLLIIYGLTDRSIIQALKDKAEEGVQVTVICDAKVCADAKRKLGNKIRTIKRSSMGLMHMKILVIDKQKTWIGSANMTTESLRIHGNLITGIYDLLLAKVITDKADEMIKRQKSNQKYQNKFKIAGQDIELWFLPDPLKAFNRLLKVINEANKTIYIAMFAWTHPRLADAVIEAHKRGVKVEIIVDHQLGKGAGAEIVTKLHQAGVSVSLSEGNSLLHYKCLYVDEKVLVSGSTNWTRAAFKQNDDCFLILNDMGAEMKKQMNALFNIILLESQPYKQN